jgi:hypothetical protein
VPERPVRVGLGGLFVCIAAAFVALALHCINPARVNPGPVGSGVRDKGREPVSTGGRLSARHGDCGGALPRGGG